VYVVVAVDARDDGVVQSVQLLQQRQLFAVRVQRRVVGHRQAEQNLAARVRLELAPQVVELSLHTTVDGRITNLLYIIVVVIVIVAVTWHSKSTMLFP